MSKFGRKEVDFESIMEEFQSIVADVIKERLNEFVMESKEATEMLVDLFIESAFESLIENLERVSTLMESEEIVSKREELYEAAITEAAIKTSGGKSVLKKALKIGGALATAGAAGYGAYKANKAGEEIIASVKKDEEDKLPLVKGAVSIGKLFGNDTQDAQLDSAFSSFKKNLDSDTGVFDKLKVGAKHYAELLKQKITGEDGEDAKTKEYAKRIMFGNNDSESIINRSKEITKDRIDGLLNSTKNAIKNRLGIDK